MKKLWCISVYTVTLLFLVAGCSFGISEKGTSSFSVRLALPREAAAAAASADLHYEFGGELSVSGNTAVSVIPNDADSTLAWTSPEVRAGRKTSLYLRLSYAGKTYAGVTETFEVKAGENTASMTMTEIPSADISLPSSGNTFDFRSAKNWYALFKKTNSELATDNPYAAAEGPAASAYADRAAHVTFGNDSDGNLVVHVNRKETADIWDTVLMTPQFTYTGGTSYKVEISGYADSETPFVLQMTSFDGTKKFILTTECAGTPSTFGTEQKTLTYYTMPLDYADSTVAGYKVNDMHIGLWCGAHTGTFTVTGLTVTPAAADTAVPGLMATSLWNGSTGNAHTVKNSTDGASVTMTDTAAADGWSRGADILFKSGVQTEGDMYKVSFTVTLPADDAYNNPDKAFFEYAFKYCATRETDQPNIYGRTVSYQGQENESYRLTKGVPYTITVYTPPVHLTDKCYPFMLSCCSRAKGTVVISEPSITAVKESPAAYYLDGQYQIIKDFTASYSASSATMQWNYYPTGLYGSTYAAPVAILPHKKALINLSYFDYSAYTGAYSGAGQAEYADIGATWFNGYYNGAECSFNSSLCRLDSGITCSAADASATWSQTAVANNTDSLAYILVTLDPATYRYYLTSISAVELAAALAKQSISAVYLTGL